MLSSNSARIRTRGHSGVVPGAGSRTGSSPASSSVSDVAPTASSASSNGSGAAAPTDTVSCRKGMRTRGAARGVALLLDAQSALQVVDVQPAGLEGGVVEDLLVQRDVRLDALDDHFGQRVLHARDRSV